MLALAAGSGSRLVDEAFAKLEEEHPETAQLVKLRYFAGMSLADAAPLMGYSLATAKRRWIC